MEKSRTLQPIMNAILVFECAGRLGSFSAAARALGTSQPSVSRHISNLEHHVGCRLFARHNNKIALTQTGHSLFEAARKGTDAIYGVISEHRKSIAPNVLTIGCTHGFSHLWLMPRFSRLQAVIKDWEIRVITSENSHRSSPEDVDFLVHYCSGDGAGQSGSDLFAESVILVASPDLLATYKQAKSDDPLNWLRALPLIHLDDGEEGWVSWRDWFADQGIPYSPPADTYFYRNYAFSLQAAAEGKGVALAWHGLLGPYQENGWLQTLDFEPMRTQGRYQLTRSAKWNDPLIGAQVDHWFKDETASIG